MSSPCTPDAEVSRNTSTLFSWAFPLLSIGLGQSQCCVLEFFTFSIRTKCHVTEVVPPNYTWIMIKVIFCENSAKMSVMVTTELLERKGTGGRKGRVQGDRIGQGVS